MINTTAYPDGVRALFVPPFAGLAACITLFASVLLPASGHGSAKDGELDLSGETVYRVTITTSFDFPANSGIPRVQVSHGLPVERPWSEGDHDSSGRNVEFQPAKGDIENDRKSGASYIVWEERVPSKGGPMVFTTTYETTSVTRDIGSEGEKKAKWKSRRVRAEKDMHPEIVEQAKLLIEESTPLDALRKFSGWLEKRVVYDASVPNTCVDDTMSNGAGHCGHRAAVLRQFAEALGIASRPIGGAHLNHPDGATDGLLFKLNPTWSNTHAWVELEIPGLGWVEIEPVGKDKIFAVPARYVQTRGNFQNYDVRLMRGGKWVKPEWQTVSEDGGNRFVSDVGLRNVITFDVLSGPAPDNEEQAPTAASLGSSQGRLTSAP